MFRSPFRDYKATYTMKIEKYGLGYSCVIHWFSTVYRTWLLAKFYGDDRMSVVKQALRFKFRPPKCVPLVF